MATPEKKGTFQFQYPESTTDEESGDYEVWKEMRPPPPVTCSSSSDSDNRNRKNDVPISKQNSKKRKKSRKKWTTVDVSNFIDNINVITKDTQPDLVEFRSNTSQNVIQSKTSRKKTKKLVSNKNGIIPTIRFGSDDDCNENYSKYPINNEKKDEPLQATELLKQTAIEEYFNMVNGIQKSSNTNSSTSRIKNNENLNSLPHQYSKVAAGNSNITVIQSDRSSMSSQESVTPNEKLIKKLAHSNERVKTTLDKSINISNKSELPPCTCICKTHKPLQQNTEPMEDEKPPIDINRRKKELIGSNRIKPLNSKIITSPPKSNAIKSPTKVKSGNIANQTTKFPPSNYQVNSSTSSLANYVKTLQSSNTSKIIKTSGKLRNNSRNEEPTLVVKNQFDCLILDSTSESESDEDDFNQICETETNKELMVDNSDDKKLNKYSIGEKQNIKDSKNKSVDEDNGNKNFKIDYSFNKLDINGVDNKDRKPIRDNKDTMEAMKDNSVNKELNINGLRKKQKKVIKDNKDSNYDSKNSAKNSNSMEVSKKQARVNKDNKDVKDLKKDNSVDKESIINGVSKKQNKIVKGNKNVEILKQGNSVINGIDKNQTRLIEVNTFFQELKKGIEKNLNIKGLGKEQNKLNTDNKYVKILKKEDDVNDINILSNIQTITTKGNNDLKQQGKGNSVNKELNMNEVGEEQNRIIKDNKVPNELKKEYSVDKERNLNGASKKEKKSKSNKEVMVLMKGVDDKSNMNDKTNLIYLTGNKELNELKKETSVDKELNLKGPSKKQKKINNNKEVKISKKGVDDKLNMDDKTHIMTDNKNLNELKKGNSVDKEFNLNGVSKKQKKIKDNEAVKNVKKGVDAVLNMNGVYKQKTKIIADNKDPDEFKNGKTVDKELNINGVSKNQKGAKEEVDEELEWKEVAKTQIKVTKNLEDLKKGDIEINMSGAIKKPNKNIKDSKNLFDWQKVIEEEFDFDAGNGNKFSNYRCGEEMEIKVDLTKSAQDNQTDVRGLMSTIRSDVLNFMFSSNEERVLNRSTRDKEKLNADKIEDTNTDVVDFVQSESTKLLKMLKIDDVDLGNEQKVEKPISQDVCNKKTKTPETENSSQNAFRASIMNDCSILQRNRHTLKNTTSSANIIKNVSESVSNKTQQNLETNIAITTDHTKSEKKRSRSRKNKGTRKTCPENINENVTESVGVNMRQVLRLENNTSNDLCQGYTKYNHQNKTIVNKATNTGAYKKKIIATKEIDVGRGQQFECRNSLVKNAQGRRCGRKNRNPDQKECHKNEEVTRADIALALTHSEFTEYLEFLQYSLDSKNSQRCVWMLDYSAFYFEKELNRIRDQNAPDIIQKESRPFLDHPQTFFYHPEVCIFTDDILVDKPDCADDEDSCFGPISNNRPSLTSYLRYFKKAYLTALTGVDDYYVSSYEEIVKIPTAQKMSTNRRKRGDWPRVSGKQRCRVEYKWKINSGPAEAPWEFEYPILLERIPHSLDSILSRGSRKYFGEIRMVFGNNEVWDKEYLDSINTDCYDTEDELY